MKIRNGFVSNSSSSSFTCDVCGATESGWDICLSDCEMYECENGHTFCEDEAVKPTLEERVVSYIERCKTRVESSKATLKYAKEHYQEQPEYITGREEYVTKCEDALEEALKNRHNTDEDYWEDIIADLDDDRYEVPSCYCPICQMTAITDSDAKNYMLRKFSTSYEEMKKEIKSRFKSYGEFKEFMKS